MGWKLGDCDFNRPVYLVLGSGVNQITNKPVSWCDVYVFRTYPAWWLEQQGSDPDQGGIYVFYDRYKTKKDALKQYPAAVDMPASLKDEYAGEVA